MTSNALIAGSASSAANAQPQPRQAPRARLIAFYLPQYYPIPENDKWWGLGFTEWTNVAKARPLFPGHRQPNVPADLGFYDLRVPETRVAQAQMASKCGIEGFCYWHYWFGNGRRVLQRPFAEVLESGEPNFPFCLAWANDSWSGVWYGNPKTILIQQTYPGPEDEAAHFSAVLPAFRDERYVRVEGKPLFVVFNPFGLPNSNSFIAHWRQLAVQAGLPGLFLVALANNYRDDRLAQFDAITPHPPHDFLRASSAPLVKRIARRLRRRDFGPFVNQLVGDRLRRPRIYSYRDVVKTAFSEFPGPADRRFLPCVLPNWDNTPRSGRRGFVFEQSSPELFREYLVKGLALIERRSPELRICFIKAWNEWAEGNYLEPDLQFGHAYLDVIRAEMFRPVTVSETISAPDAGLQLSDRLAGRS
jgi:hypothetical protein